MYFSWCAKSLIRSVILSTYNKPLKIENAYNIILFKMKNFHCFGKTTTNHYNYSMLMQKLKMEMFS